MKLGLKQFFGGLESLRGVAALIVVFFHVNDFNWPNPLTSHRFFCNGYLMVDLFFVLSGFVICHNYRLKIGDAGDIGHFMFLRLGRLYPLHLYCLLAFLGIEIAKYIGQLKFNFVPHVHGAFSANNAPSFVANLLLIQSFFSFSNLTFDGPSWSISVEFYTYLIFAVVILFFPKKKSFLVVSGSLILLTMLPLLLCNVNGVTVLPGWSFLRCVLGFFIGVLAYHIYDHYHRYISRWSEKVAFCLLIILIIFMSFRNNAEVDGILVLPVFFALIITIAAEPAGLISKMVNSAPLRWLGRVSYSIYMLHYMVLMFVFRLFVFTQKYFHTDNRNEIGLAFVFLAITLVLIISQFTYQWIEKPYQNEFRDLATKWFKQWKGCA